MSSSSQSPQILTPEAAYAFPKLPVKPTSDSDDPPSLLTAILHSPKGAQSGILQKPTPILKGSEEVGLGLEFKPEAHLKFAAQPDEHEVILRPDPESDPDYPRRGSLRDSGYEEDSEDGFSSDDDFAFARPTNYTFSQPTSHVTSPATSPPPIRRGRGHIRVAAAATDKACSRHCSPPPSRSGSEAPPPASSPSARRVKRLPKFGSESGSCSSANSTSEDDDDEVESSVNGWRSDDPKLYESRSAALVEPTTSVASRRASEHLPFRPFLPTSSPMPSQPTCPPVLTPTTVSTALSRARSLGKVTFRDLPHRARPVKCPPRSEGEELGWTDAGRLAIRRAARIEEPCI